MVRDADTQAHRQTGSYTQTRTRRHTDRDRLADAYTKEYGHVDEHTQANTHTDTKDRHTHTSA
eukprot:10043748-Alexandrium_andersonii.AAC.1